MCSFYIMDSIIILMGCACRCFVGFSLNLYLLRQLGIRQCLRREEGRMPLPISIHTLILLLWSSRWSEKTPKIGVLRAGSCFMVWYAM